MKKLIRHCPYYGLEHLVLIRMGFKEMHCLFVDDTVFVRMELWMEVTNATV